MLIGLPPGKWVTALPRSEEHTSELQSHVNLVCRLLLEKKKKKKKKYVKTTKKNTKNIYNHTTYIHEKVRTEWIINLNDLTSQKRYILSVIMVAVSVYNS